MQKFTAAMQKHYKKAAAAAVAVFAVTGAQAAMTVTSVIADIDAVVDPVNSVAAATIGVAVVMYGWRKVRGAIR